MGAMETPQHGIWPKKKETSPKWFFSGVSCFFKNYWKSLKSNFLRNFPLFLSISMIFRLDSGLYGSYIFEGFPNIFYLFPHFLGPFPVSRKSCKFSVCWSVSSFLGPFPLFSVRFLFFRVCFRFSKKVSNSQFVDRFPLFFWVRFLFFVSFSSFKKKFQILSLLIDLCSFFGFWFLSFFFFFLFFNFFILFFWAFFIIFFLLFFLITYFF